MTGYKSRHFRHDCDVDDCYYKQLPEWDDLIECFPRNIRPTDVDGMVEINGHVLFLEEKGPSVKLHEGQRRALRSLSMRPAITTLFFRPVAKNVTDLECLVLGQGDPLGWQRKERAWLKDWLRDWAAHADSNPYIPGRTELGDEAALPIRDKKVRKGACA